jgi:general secretion pathway protein C
MEQNLQRWSWVASACASLLAAFLCARIVNTFVAVAIAPKPAFVLSALGSGAARPNFAQRVELDALRFAKAFDLPIPKPPPTAGEVEAAKPPPPPPSPTWTEAPIRSSLHGVLVSTAIANPDKWSLCQILNTDNNETAVYAVGDYFLTARIYRIERMAETGKDGASKDRVLVENEGRNEYIDASAAAPPVAPLAPVPTPVAAAGPSNIKQLSENNYSIPKKEIDSALSNLADLSTKARIVPSFKNGVSNGFKLFSIVPDSLYAQIGVQNGDVIRKINGYEMNSPDKALEIYQKLRDANRVEIELERRGETVRKLYTIE